MEYIDWKVSGIMNLRNSFGYRVTLTLPDGTEKVQQKSGFATAKDAQQGRDLAVAQLYSNSYVTEKGITVRDYFTNWLENVIRCRCKVSTYSSYYYTLKNHIYPNIGGVKLAELTKAHILYLYRLVGEKYESVVKQCRVILETGLRLAKMNHLISVDPAKDVLIPRDIYDATPYHKMNINPAKTLTVEQLNLLIENSRDTKIYLFVLFAGLMGLRKSEIIGLKYSDVNFAYRTLHVRRQLGRDLSKENIKPKTKTKQEIELKSRSSNRVLNIPDIVFEAIMDERQRYEANRRRRAKQFQDLDYICCSTYGRPRSASFCYKLYKQLLWENELPNIRFHDLRHTYATLLLKQDLSVKAISDSLGHAKTIISVDMYGDKREIIKDCVCEIQPVIDEVMPKKTQQKKYPEFYFDNLMLNKGLIAYVLAI